MNQPMSSFGPPQMSKKQVKEAINQEISQLTARQLILNRRITTMTAGRDVRRALVDSVVNEMPRMDTPLPTLLHDMVPRWEDRVMLTFTKCFADMCLADADMTTITIEEMVEELTLITDHIKELHTALKALESNIVIPHFGSGGPVSN